MSSGQREESTREQRASVEGGPGLLGAGLLEARGPELVELVVERIEGPINRGQYAPGDRLPPERLLAAELGVSRATVREALHELELKGLVERRQGRGTLVTAAERGEIAQHLLQRLAGRQRDVLELMDFRDAIEVPAAARAAKYATGAEISALRRIVERMGVAVSRERYVELDSRFHHMIARASHNTLLARVVEWSNEWTAATRDVLVEDPHRRRVSLEGHRAILAAIAGRDPDVAAGAMREHLRTVSEALTERRGAVRAP